MSVFFDLTEQSAFALLPAAVVVTSQGLTVTDGTVAGTSVIKPNAAADQFYARDEMASLGNSALFVAGSDPATDVSFGTQLWRTDGTAAGTSVVLTLPNNAVYSPDTGWSGDAGIFDLTSIGARSLFVYSDGSSFDPSTYQLWSSDGTAAGTFRLPVDASYIDGAATVGGQTLLATSQGLVITDGTAAGTSVLTTVVPDGYQIVDLVQVAGGAAFLASEVEAANSISSSGGRMGRRRDASGPRLSRSLNRFRGPDPFRRQAAFHRRPFHRSGDGLVNGRDIGRHRGAASLQYPSDTTPPSSRGATCTPIRVPGSAYPTERKQARLLSPPAEQGVLPTPFMAPLGDELLFMAQEPTGLFYDRGGEKLIPAAVSNRRHA